MTLDLIPANERQRDTMTFKEKQGRSNFFIDNISYLRIWQEKILFKYDVSHDHLIYVLQGRKYPRILVDQHEYNVHKKEENRTRWRCTSEKNTKCKAVCYTSGNTVVLRRQHNHPPKQIDNLNLLTSQYVKIIRQ
nr:unnamed protein product [Callosobruchus chinensis]